MEASHPFAEQWFTTCRVALLQVKAEIDRIAQLELDRSNLAFGAAMVRLMSADLRIWVKHDTAQLHSGFCFGRLTSTRTPTSSRKS
jgi:hypothetical protein